MAFSQILSLVFEISSKNLYGKAQLGLFDSENMRYIHLRRIFNENNRYLIIFYYIYQIAEEVQEEARRIKQADLSDLVDKEPIVAKNLSKLFKKDSKYFYAVDNLSFGVASAECFGLLGLNGAGKTTTIEILTGQKKPNDGSSFLNGFNSTSRRSSATSELGICPQFVRRRPFY